jgi:dolichol-phosphate mannosyltransferase
MDTDLTFAPSLIGDLLERFDRGDVDVVSGSPKLAGFGADIPSYRVVISKLSTVIYSALLGRQVTTVSPILRLYRRRDLVDLPLQANGFEINAEILFALIQRGARIAEVPAPLTQRLHGESKLDYPREIRRHLRLVRRMAAWRVARAARR